MSEKYMGDPRRELTPGGVIPTEREGPFAVLITPQFAQYVLDKLNAVNRGKKAKIAQMAADITAGNWRYPAEALHFRENGLLGNGQNRLTAITWAGIPQWFRVEFGWPDESIDVIDLGSSRTTGDVLRFHGVPDPNTVSAIVTTVARYDETAGSVRSWMNSATNNRVPSAALATELYEADSTAYNEAVKTGGRISKALENGLPRALWGAAYYICARAYPAEAKTFFDAIEQGNSVQPAVIAIREHAMRRKLNDYARQGQTMDRREPLENILRAFQASMKHDRPGFVRQAGFKLTAISTRRVA